MPLHIGPVDMDMEVIPDAGGARAPAEGAGAPSGGERMLRDRLRPIVLEILAEELERLRRQHG